MEKPYYKSLLRLQKKLSTTDKLIYKYNYNGIEMTIQVTKLFPNLNKISFKFSYQKEYDITLFANITKLNINRILNSEYKGKCWIIKIQDIYAFYLSVFNCTLLQCGFVLQYTKEYGYHFIR